MPAEGRPRWRAGGAWAAWGRHTHANGGTMSTVPVPTPHVVRAERSLPAWVTSEALWAGLSIVTIWLAVLFVRIFGGQIVNGTAFGGDSVPVVVVVAFFGLRCARGGRCPQDRRSRPDQSISGA